jgi:hypothetical protein
MYELHFLDSQDKRAIIYLGERNERR